MFTKFKTLASKHLAPKEAKADDRADAEASSTTRYLDTLKEYALLMEYQRVAQQSPAGVYILPSSSSLSLWHGLIFVRKGFYRKAILPFTVTIPPSYPTSPPSIHFPTLPFHPLISPSGHLTLHPTCHPWSPSTHHLLHTIAHVKKAFYHTDWWADPTPPTPPSALFRSDRGGEFMRRVERCVRESVEGVYEVGGEMRVTRPRGVHEEVWRRVQERWRVEEGRGGGGAEVLGGYLEWFMPGVNGLADEEGGDGGKIRVGVSAEEEKEWMEEELKRRSAERQQRVNAAVIAQEQPAPAPADSEDPVEEKPVDPPLHVLDEEETVLP